MSDPETEDVSVEEVPGDGAMVETPDEGGSPTKRRRSPIQQAAQPRSLQEIREIANILYDSGFFSDIRNASQATAKILAGAELGLDPMESMRSVHAFDGKTSLHYSQILSLIRRSEKYDYEILESTEQKASIKFFRHARGEWREEGTQEWTIEDAKQAGLAGKKNWSNYPRAMLLGRAATEGQRKYCPDVGGGPLYVPEELGAEVDEDGRAVAPPKSSGGAVSGRASGTQTSSGGQGADRHLKERELDDSDRWAGISPDGKKRLRKIDMWLLDADVGEELESRIEKVEDSISDPSTTLAGYVRHLVANHQQRGQASGGYPSENQIGLLYGIADEGFDDDSIDRLVKQGWGFDSKADIPSREVFEQVGFQLQDPHYASKYSRDPDTRDMEFEGEEPAAGDGLRQDAEEYEEIDYTQRIEDLDQWLETRPIASDDEDVTVLEEALTHIQEKISGWPKDEKRRARAAVLPHSARYQIQHHGYEALEDLRGWVEEKRGDLPDEAVDEAIGVLETEAEALAPSTGEQAAEAMLSGETALGGDEPDGTPLPDDFPGRDELLEEGLETVEAVRDFDDELETIYGIGKVTASHIRNTLDEIGGNASF